MENIKKNEDEKKHFFIETFYNLYYSIIGELNISLLVYKIIGIHKQIVYTPFFFKCI